MCCSNLRSGKHQRRIVNGFVKRVITDGSGEIKEAESGEDADEGAVPLLT